MKIITLILLTMTSSAFAFNFGFTVNKFQRNLQGEYTLISNGMSCPERITIENNHRQVIIRELNDSGQPLQFYFNEIGKGAISENISWTEGKKVKTDVQKNGKKLVKNFKSCGPLTFSCNKTYTKTLTLEKIEENVVELWLAYSPITWVEMTCKYQK
jgi:hypothetical protein